MKRFLFEISSFVCVILILVSVACFCLPIPSLRTNMLEGLKSKNHRLRTVEGNRVVLIGGSNLSFGINSELLSNELGRPVVNMGLHGGLGLKYHLAEALDGLRSGDVAVIVPEYDQFDNFEGQIELLNAIVDIVPENQRLLDWSHWLHLAPMIPVYGAKKLMRLFQVRQKCQPYSGFTVYGDMKHDGEPTEQWKSLRPKGKAPLRMVNPNVLVTLQRFKRECDNRQVQVVMLPPVYMAWHFDFNQDFIRQIETALRAISLPFAVSPERYKFPNECFADTHYHLQAKPCDERTHLVAEDIGKVIR